MVENRIDILIDSFFNGKGIKDAIDRVEDLHSKLQKMQRMQKLMSDYSEIGVSFNKNGQAIDSLTKKYVSHNDILDRINKQNAFIDQQKSLQKSAGAQEKSLSRLGNTFSMEYLGILFFGMQIKALFEGVARSTVASFMKISEGATSQGQAVNALNATWELLKFSIGSAIGTVLEGLLPVILPIIESITDWIQRNEKLVGWFIIIAIVVGTVLMVFGSLVIGIEAIGNAIVKLISGTSSLNALGKAINGVKFGTMLTGFSALLVWILVVLAAVYVLVKLWKANFGRIQEFTKGALDSIGIMLGALGEFIVGIFTGDDNKILRSIAKFIYGAGTLFARFAVFGKDVFFELTGWVAKKFVDMGTTIAKTMAKLWAFLDPDKAEAANAAIDALDKLRDAWKDEIDGKTLELQMTLSQEDLTAQIQKDLESINKWTPFNDASSEAEKTFESVSEIKNLIEAGALSGQAGRVWVAKDFKDSLPDFDFWLKMRDATDSMTQLTQTDFGVNTDFSNALSSLTNGFNSVISQTNIASSVSQNMALQNQLEVDSWNAKTEAITNTNLAIENNNRLMQSYGGNSLPVTLDRATGNFVTTNL